MSRLKANPRRGRFYGLESAQPFCIRIDDPVAKMFNIGGPSWTGTVSGPLAIGTNGRPMVMVIDKILWRGFGTSTTGGNENAEIDFFDGSVRGTIRLIVPNLNTVTVRHDYQMDFGGRLALPSNCGIRFETNAGSTLCPEIHGWWVDAEEAHKFDIAVAAEDWFCVGTIPANTTNTELLATRTGKSIQIEGFSYIGAPTTWPAGLNIALRDGSTDYTIFRFRHGTGSNTYYNPFVQTGYCEINTPLGASLRYTADTNAPDRVAFNVFGRYVDAHETFNPWGLTDLAGTATAGAAGTLTNSNRKWVTNRYTNFTVTIVSGTGAGQTRTIASNTATVLTLSSNWTTNPDNTSVYVIAPSEGARKWWCYADFGTLSNDQDTAIQLLPNLFERFAVIRGYQFSGDSAYSGVATQAPTLQIRSATSSRFGSGVATTLGVPGSGLPGSASNVLSPVVAIQAAGDLNTAVGDIEVPVLLNTSAVLNAEGTHAWTNLHATLWGTWEDSTERSSSTLAVNRRFGNPN